MGLRRRARELAMQMLYQSEITGEETETLARAFLDRVPAEEESKRFAGELFRGTLRETPVLDEVLSRYLANWTLTRLAAVDRAILRMALYEFRCLPSVPATVTINEAVELAKRYSTDESGRFVNGVLDRLRIEENILDRKTPAARAPRKARAVPAV